MNKVILMGRLTRDPEIRSTQSGKQVATFSVAVNRNGKNNEADFISCLAWEKSAEIIGKYFSKGKQILLEGRLQLRQYEDKSGKKCYITEVVVERIEFVGDKGNSEQSNKEYGGKNNGGYNKGFGSFAGQSSSDDDDIPF